MIKLTPTARERSTFVIAAAFTDEGGNAVVPSSIAWTLVDKNETVVNGREQVAVTPAAAIDVVLSGDDLAIASSVSERRWVVFEVVYSSDAGNDLPLKEAAEFAIEPLPYIE